MRCSHGADGRELMRPFAVGYLPMMIDLGRLCNATAPIFEGYRRRGVIPFHQVNTSGSVAAYSDDIF